MDCEYKSRFEKFFHKRNSLEQDVIVYVCNDIFLSSGVDFESRDILYIFYHANGESYGVGTKIVKVFQLFRKFRLGRPQEEMLRNCLTYEVTIRFKHNLSRIEFLNFDINTVKESMVNRLGREAKARPRLCKVDLITRENLKNALVLHKESAAVAFFKKYSKPIQKKDLSGLFNQIHQSGEYLQSVLARMQEQSGSVRKGTANIKSSFRRRIAARCKSELAEIRTTLEMLCSLVFWLVYSWIVWPLSRALRQLSSPRLVSKDHSESFLVKVFKHLVASLPLPRLEKIVRGGIREVALNYDRGRVCLRSMTIVRKKPLNVLRNSLMTKLCVELWRTLLVVYFARIGIFVKINAEDHDIGFDIEQDSLKFLNMYSERKICALLNKIGLKADIYVPYQWGKEFDVRWKDRLEFINKRKAKEVLHVA